MHQSALTTRPPLKAVVLSATLFLHLALSFSALADTGVESPPTDKTPQQLLELGQQAYQANQLDTALEYFTQLMERHPNHPEAPFRIGVILMKKNQFEDAFAMINRSIELAPTNLAIRFTLAAMYERARAYDRALEEYRAIHEIAQSPQQKQKAQNRMDRLRATRAKETSQRMDQLSALEQAAWQQPDDVDAQLALAEAYLSAGRFLEAQRSYENVLTLEPDNPQALVRITELHKQTGNTEDALATLQTLLDNSPTGSILEAATGLTLTLTKEFRNTDPQRALTYFEPLAEANPDNVAVQTNLGLLYDAARDFRKAQNAYKKALELDPENALIYANLARLYLEGGRQDLAYVVLEKVIDLDQDTTATRQATAALTKVLMQQGAIKTQRGQLKQANQFHQRAIELNPNNTELLYNIARVYYDARHYAVANDYFEQLKARTPGDPRIYYYQGQALNELGQLDAALSAWEKVAQMSDEGLAETEEIAYNIALIQAKKAYSEQRYDDAERVFDHLSQQTETDFIPFFYLALISEQTGRPQQATELYEKVIEIEPGHTGARLQLGRIYERGWQEEEALAQYNLIRSSGVGTNIAAEAERRAEALSKRISGFSYSLTQAMTADSNSNLSKDDPESDIRSELSFALRYRNKLRHNLRLRIGLNSGYTAFVIRGTDLFSLGLSPSITLGNNDRGLEAGVSHREVFSFLTGADINVNDSIYGEFRTRFDPKRIFPKLKLGGAENDLWTLRGRFSFNKLESFSNRFLSSDSYSAQTFLVLHPKQGQALNLGYNLTVRDNVNPEGSDYANLSHSFSAAWEKAMSAKITTSLRYGLTWTLYSNPDSFSTEGFKRRNLRHNVAASANYAFHSNARLFGGYNLTLNTSNLPVRDTRSDLEVNLQSASLGDYRSHTLTFGLSLSF